MTKVIITLILLSMINSGCHQPVKDPTPTSAPVAPVSVLFTGSYDITSLPFTEAFDSSLSLGTIEDLALNEIAGIATSYSTSNAMWVEEDSGNENKIYLLTNSGKELGSFRMTSIANRDWEDLCISTGPVANIRYLYLAETGDNKLNYPIKYIYRFPEPTLANTTYPFSGEIASVDKIAFQYPDGVKNAEAVMVDPSTNDIYIISKEGQAVIYVARYPQIMDKMFTIVKLGSLPISDVTAADISQDGNEVLIKNYALILYWRKKSIESISDLLQTVPQRAPYVPEPKGESIGWANDGSGYFTTSEIIDNNPVSINFYKRKK